MPIVSTLCVVGAYALNNNNFDLISLIFFGGLGYVLTKASIPLAPLLLAMILSGIIEINFRRTIGLFNNDYTVFFTRPISAFFVIVSILIVARILFKELKKYRNTVHGQESL